MVQQLRETSEAMIAEEEKQVERILNERPRGHYWIIIAHKPLKQRLNGGQFIIKKVVMVSEKKPEALLGTIVLEVNDGQIISHEISPLDAPIDYGRIEKHAGSTEYSQFIVNPRAASAYVYN
jgi:hypothetical protein